MAQKDIQDTGLTTTTDTQPSTHTSLMPQGAVTAFQSSLTKLQENTVQDIDPKLIDNAGFQDRLGSDDEAQARLVDSIRAYGQQVPVLLRPHATEQGRYEIVYGRRRLQALKDLGTPVKAMVRQLDDHALVLAQGQENNARKDLSFIEKASFASQLLHAGYERQTIADALSTDLPMMSRFIKIGSVFPLVFLRHIGSAPSIGRDRWTKMARLLDHPDAKLRYASVFLKDAFQLLPSDERFEVTMLALEGNETPFGPSPAPKDTSVSSTPKPIKRAITRTDGTAFANVKTTRSGVTITIPSRGAKGFDAWFEANADALLTDLHARWTNQTAKDPA